MSTSEKSSFFILGSLLAIGLIVSAYIASCTLTRFKDRERSVRVKGLAEREVQANLAIWPIKFAHAGNSLPDLYKTLEGSTNQIRSYLKEQGFDDSEISENTPAIVDRQAASYVDSSKIAYRYTGTKTLTVYSPRVDEVRKAKQGIADLGKSGVVVAGDQEYGSQTEFLFTKLNEVKPEMIEQATQAARESAEKFASDSGSTLGKIKNASQGQFSINNRDSNTHHIKKVRVVSTVEYYLVD